MIRMILAYYKNKSLKFKLLFWVWISTSIATTLFTGMQVYFEYSDEVNSAKSQLLTIEKSYISQLKESLWDFNARHAGIQAESISKLAYVSHVGLFMDNQNIFSKGTLIEEQNDGLRKYQLSYDNKLLGELVVQINLNEIRKGYLLKIVKIFAYQSIKTFIVCWILLSIFSKLIVGHIFHISNFMREFDLEEDSKLELERFDGNKDELSTLVEDINILKKRLSETNQKNKEFTENLERLVIERTSELENTRAKAIYSSKLAALGEMAGGVAHEINNPLAIIGATVDSLKKAKEKNLLSDEHFFAATDSINSTIKRIADIVKGLKAVSQGGMKTEREEVNLNSVLNNVLQICREKFKSSFVELISAPINRWETSMLSAIRFFCHKFLLILLTMLLMQSSNWKVARNG